MHPFRLLLATLILLLAACNQQALIDKFVPKEEADFSRRVITLLASGDITAVEQQLDPSLATDPTTRDKLQRVARDFPSGPPADVQVVGAQTMTSAQGRRYSLTFQCTYPGKWLLANVVLNRQADRLTVLGIHVQPLPDSLEKINGLSFAGKGVVHFLMLALTIAVPVFILVALVLCIRTPIPRRKWLWVLFILFGFVQLQLNWTEGVMNVQPLSFLLFGAGYARAGPAAPIILTVSMPLGAIVFFFKRRRWLAPATA